MDGWHASFWRGVGGGCHSISNRLFVQLHVLGQWRNEPLVLRGNTQREGHRAASSIAAS